MNEMYLKNENLVYFVLKRFNIEEHEREDFEQEGRIGLLRAIKVYRDRADLQRFSFSTVAFQHIRGQISRYLAQRVIKHNAVSSLNVTMNSESENELLEFIEDEDADIYRVVEQMTESQRIRAGLKAIVSDLEFQILLLHFGYEKSIADTAIIVGLEHRKTQLMCTEAVRKVRASMWGRAERKSRRVNDGDSYIKAKSYEYRPEMRTKSGAVRSSVEDAVLERESELEHEQRFEDFKARIERREKQAQERLRKKLEQLGESAESISEMMRI